MIGNLQGSHDTLTGIVDVAMIRSLKKKEGFHPMLKEYSQVYFDECHHAASDSAIEACEHYAVIDHEIVWYGSVNLLSKEDAEDNLMRVCSKDIAAELLEMTFGTAEEMQEW